MYKSSSSRIPGDSLLALLFDTRVVSEVRNGQIRMAGLIVEAFKNETNAVIEGPAGLGKSFAYIIGAINQHIHVKKGVPVVISTATKVLQRQLIEKDLPCLLNHVRKEFNLTIRYAVAKGKGNYLCRYWLGRLKEEGSLFLTDEFDLWARQSSTGDLGELDRVYPELGEVHCANCVMKACPSFPHAEGCFYFRAYQGWKKADILVTNHSMIGADLSMGKGSLLPDYRFLIVDEAHQFEDSLRGALTEGVSYGRIMGILESIDRGIKPYPLRGDVDKKALDLFSLLNEQMDFHHYKSRVDGDVLKQEGVYSRIAILHKALEVLLEWLRGHVAMDEEEESIKSLYEDRVEGMKAVLSGVISSSNGNMVTYVEKEGDSKKGVEGIIIKMAPVDISIILKERLYSNTKSIILTSATLKAGGGFDYLKDTLGFECASNFEVSLESPFSTDEQTILYIPERIEDPNRKEKYYPLLEKEINSILEVSRGRAFVLFTSRKDLKTMYNRINGKDTFPLIAQGITDMNREKMLKWFCSNDGAVLFGLRSFWEGVDIKGDLLRAVIVVKLPFSPPDDPLFRARARKIEERYGVGSSFMRLSLPEAILGLKQGLGRLIRSREDRGILAVLDSRVVTRHYGRVILETLAIKNWTSRIEDVNTFWLIKGK